MARILTDGAEMGDIVLFASSTGILNVTTAPRSGSRCYKQTGTGNYVTSAIDMPGGGLSEFYIRIGVKVDLIVGGGNNDCIVEFRHGSTVLATVHCNPATGHLLYTCGATTVEGTIPFLVDTWYLLEVHYKVANAGGVFEGRLDGVPDGSMSGDTQPGADTTVDNFSTLTRTMAMYWDDIALNDLTGGVDDSWCGDGHIVMVSPNGNGDSSMLAGSDGNSVNNYLLVDEIPPNSDTDYVESSTPNDIDEYTMGNITLQPGESISKVWIESRARELAADGDSIAVGIKSGGTTDWNSNTPVTTTYMPIVNRRRSSVKSSISTYCK